jgi:hypothetical protein
MTHHSRAIALASLCVTSAMTAFSQRSNLVPVSYQYEKTEGSVTRVFPVSDYLESVRKGGTINAFPWRPCCVGYFSWSFPELSVKSTNSTRQPAYFSELIFNVSKSERNDEPVLLLDVGFEGHVSLINEGWGAVIEPALKFDMTISQGEYRQPTPDITRPVTISNRMVLTSFDKYTTLDFAQFLPERFRPTQDRSDFENIANELRHQYNIFYRPEPLKADGLYHSVAVKVKTRHDLLVKARKGYYAPKL